MVIVGGEETRTWTSRAPASRSIRTILRDVVPADDRVVHEDDALALDDLAHRVQLDLDAEVADRLLGLDERAPDVVVADEAEGERDARLLGVAERRVHAGVGHGHDDVGLGRVLAREAARRTPARDAATLLPKTFESGRAK